MNVLVVDIGGTNVKLWKTEAQEKTKFPTGKELTPKLLVEGMQEAVGDWNFDRVSIGFPGEILHNAPKSEPINLGPGWVGFDFGLAFGKPVRVMNDACMQALGSYEGGKMLYLGLGTSMGTAFVHDRTIIPLSLGHIKFHRGETFDHYLSRKGLELHGEKRWRRAVFDAATVWREAFQADYVVLGGGNAKRLTELPDGCRLGSNFNAYIGGVRMWDDAQVHTPAAAPPENPELSLFPADEPPRAVEA